MQNVITCSFCQKPQGVIRDEAATPGTRTVSICRDCLQVCRGILKKEVKSGAESGSYRVSSSRPDPVGPLCCSFCDTPQQIVEKLIGSPPGVTPTYICDKCVALGDRTIQKNTGHIGPLKSLWHRLARKVGIHNSLLRQRFISGRVALRDLLVVGQFDLRNR